MKRAAWIPVGVFAICLAAVPLFGCSLTQNGSNDSGAGDDAGTGGDDDGAGPGDDGEPGPMIQRATIYQLQKGEIAPETVVQLSSVVVTSPINVGETDGAVVVQEQDGGEFSGMYLFLYADVVDHLELAPGDVVDVVGIYNEYYDFSEVTITNTQDIQVVGSAAVPEPAVVNAADIATGGAKSEAYESVLVQVQNVKVTAADAGHGDFEVEGGLLVDDFFIPPVRPAMDATIESITGILMYSFEAFRLAPRTNDDVTGHGGIAEDVTIFDIQQGKVPENTTVSLKDVVVTSPLHAEKGGIFIADPQGGPYSGIYVYLFDEVAAAVNLQPGTLINLSGEYTEFYGASELTVRAVEDLEVVGMADVPSPEVIASSMAADPEMAEPYESVLVRVENVEVTNPDPGFYNLEVDGVLLVEPFFMELGQHAMGTVFTSITGPLMYSFEAFRIRPRTQADLVVNDVGGG